MKQFNLEEYKKNSNRKVVTRQGKSVRIICTDRRHTDSWPIVALEDYGDGEFVIYANIDGRTDMCSENIHDLFFADEEEEPQSIEIPFGAKDSEFIKDEYYIPEGCEAKIEGNKVIIEKIQKEEELTEFEKTMIQFSHERNSLIQFEHTTEEINAHLYRYSEKLLNLARKEILKDLPKWKKDDNHLSSLIYQLDNRGNGNILLCRKEYAININELLNLPKEE